MKKMLVSVVILGLALVNFGAAYAFEDAIVYPKEEQDQQQQMFDEKECAEWAERETGLDPAVLKAKIEMLDGPQQQTTGGKLLERGIWGATKGAASGAIYQGIDNRIGSGAASGVTDSFFDGWKDDKRDQRMDAKEEYKMKQAEIKEEYKLYMKAFSVCMDARGYSVR